jgi:hypothetical protein
MKFTKELAINTGLAFVAGFVTTFGAFTEATSKNPGKVVVIAAAAAALWAGFRAAVGFVAMNAKQVPTITVDQ